MALTKQMVQRMVAVVAADPVARGRISSVLGVFGQNSGAVRNGLMVLGDLWFDGASALGNKVGLGKMENADFFDPSGNGWGAELQCNGIVEVSVNALKRKSGDFPNVSEFRLASRTAGNAHAGVFVETVDGGEYVIDWWRTLKIANPLVFRHGVWDADKPGGVLLENFVGFT
jgi:hypothetical protein